MNPNRVLGHKEWANGGRKSDPKYSMDWRRQQVAEFRATKTVHVLGSRILKLGSSGEDVRELQRLLNLLDDGQFGPKTDSAVRWIQQQNKLNVDGVVGPITLAIIRKAVPPPPATEETRPDTEEDDMGRTYIVTDPRGRRPQYLTDGIVKRWVQNSAELKDFTDNIGIGSGKPIERKTLAVATLDAIPTVGALPPTE